MAPNRILGLELTLVLFVTISCLPKGTLALFPQYFQTFPITRCIGEPTTIFESNHNISETGEERLYRSKGAHMRGLWITTDEFFISTYMDALGDTYCEAILDEFGDMVLLSAVKPHQADYDESALTLFPEEWFDGPETSINSTTEQINFGTKLYTTSFVMTGTESFSLFGEPNFEGKMTCLVPHSYVLGRGYGMTFDKGEDILEPYPVGSVKRGCSVNGKNGDQVRVIQGKTGRCSRVVDRTTGKVIEGTQQSKFQC